MGKDLLKLEGVTRVLIITTVLTIAEATCIIFQATWLMHLIYGLFEGREVSSLSSSFAVFFVFFIGRYIILAGKRKLAYHFAEVTGKDLRIRLLRKLFALGASFSKQQGTGNIVTLVLEGISQVRTYLELIIPRMVSAVVIPTMIIVYVLSQDIASSVILIVTLPIIIAFMILLGLAAKKKMNKQWETYHVLSNHFVDSLRGIETLKFIGLGKEHGHTIEQVSDRYRKSTMETLRVAFLSSFALDFFTMFSVASVAVGLGLRLINGDLLLDTALVVLILAPEFFLPIKEAGSDYHATLNGKESYEAIQAILSAPLQEDATHQGLEVKWGPFSTMKVSSLQVGYDTNSNVLTNISFQVKGYQKIGIVGASGAGKSTLIQTIGGFLSPSQGTIRLNDQLLSTLKIQNWREQITYIPQHPYIFSQSLADNVRFYRPEATDVEVNQAIAAAGLSELVSQLPGGIDEMIGNGERPLSGGQEQRVALARAFIGERSILLFDEPTAHLDIETEYELKQTMLPLLENKLVFFATHRLHWMEEMDLIVVLKDGVVVEVGSKQALLKNRGDYYSLMRSQMEGIQ